VPCSPIARRAGESLVQYRYTRPNSRNSFYGSYSRRG
jgi:hypothetical protein